MNLRGRIVKKMLKGLMKDIRIYNRESKITGEGTEQRYKGE